MKGFTFTETRVWVHRPTKECCEARVSKPRPVATFVNYVQNTII